MINFPDNSNVIDVPNNYSINSLWLNKKLNENLPYIDNSKSEDELLSKLFDRSKQWKDLNPEAEVVVWYDSDFVTEHAIKNTQEVFDRKKAEGYNIVLKDIRELDLVKANPDAFSSNVPVYFRIDILKLIICVNSIVKDSKEAAIFADLELCESKVYVGKDAKAEAEEMGDNPELTKREQAGKPPKMTKEELFDDKTMKKLQSFSFLTGGGNAGENQFVQLMRNEDTIKAIVTYINIELSRLISALNMNDDEARRILILLNKDASPKAISKMRDKVSTQVSEMIFRDTPLLLSLIVSANSQNTNEQIMIRGENLEQWIKYDPNQHGIAPLGNLKFYYDENMELIVNQESVLNCKDCVVLPNVTSKYMTEFSRKIEHTKGGGAHPDTVLGTMPFNGSKFTYQAWDILNTPTQSVSASPTNELKGSATEIPTTVVSPSARRTFAPAQKLSSVKGIEEFEDSPNIGKEKEKPKTPPVEMKQEAALSTDIDTIAEDKKSAKIAQLNKAKDKKPQQSPLETKRKEPLESIKAKKPPSADVEDVVKNKIEPVDNIYEMLKKINIKNRYDTIRVKKNIIGTAFFKSHQRQERPMQITELQNNIDNAAKLLKNGAEATLVFAGLDNKINNLLNTIENETKLLGKSKLQKVIIELKKDIICMKKELGIPIDEYEMASVKKRSGPPRNQS